MKDKKDKKLVFGNVVIKGHLGKKFTSRYGGNGPIFSF